MSLLSKEDRTKLDEAASRLIAEIRNFQHLVSQHPSQYDPHPESDVMFLLDSIRSSQKLGYQAQDLEELKKLLKNMELP